MIKDEIVDLLSLIETPYMNGSSFINNVRIYAWPNVAEGFDVFVTDGDTEGNPLQHGMLQVFSTPKKDGKKYWISFRMTEEAIQEPTAKDFVTEMLQDKLTEFSTGKKPPITFD